MKTHLVKNVFTSSQIEYLLNQINSSNIEEDIQLGRIKSTIDINDDIRSVVNNLIKNLYLEKLDLGSVSYAKYSNDYGIPNLPPHFDGDSSELILNFQIESNTNWDIGLNKNIYSLSDNTAVLFHPNKNIHWRPIKNFKNGEYIKMLFFRFYDLQNKKDYSDKRYSLDHKIFEEINIFRNSLIET